MLSKNHPLILFIDRNGFSVFQDTLTNIPKFNFTPDLVSNLDVIDKEQFTSLIATFIQVNKIAPSSLAVILSDSVIYIKDLVSPAQKPISNQALEHKDEIQNFLENIPFEEVLAKVIKAGNINRIVAVNKDLVMAISDAFTNKGSVMEAITPSFMYGQNANFTLGLTLDSVRIILGSVETLRSGNLLTDQEEITPSQNLESELKNPPANDVEKPRNLRQYMLVGIFVALLVILAVVYLNLGAAKTIPQNSKTKSASVNAVNTPIIPSDVARPTLAQAAITAVPVDIKRIKIKILQSSRIDEKATNLKNELSKMGFQNIIDEVSETSIPEKSSVVFSQDIPADLLNNIIMEIKKILPDISTLENQDSNFTISIVLGKS